MKIEDQLEVERIFNNGRAINIKGMKVTPQDPVLNHGGGQWLGWTRNYIQCKCVNGENVTWGSHDQLKFCGVMTVNEFERIAANIASTAVNEFIAKLNREGVKCE